MKTAGFFGVVAAQPMQEEIDPEYEMAIRISLEEERKRMEEIEKQKA